MIRLIRILKGANAQVGKIWLGALKIPILGDFPGSPMVKTPCFHCMGLIPDWGTKILHVMQRGQNKPKQLFFFFLNPQVTLSCIQALSILSILKKELWSAWLNFNKQFKSLYLYFPFKWGYLEGTAWWMISVSQEAVCSHVFQLALQKTQE